MFSRITDILLSALLAVVLVGCGHDSEPDPSAPSIKYQAGFFIAVGDASTSTAGTSYAPQGSRAPSDGQYHPGEGYENYISLPDNIRIAIFDLNDRYLGEMTDFVVTPLESYDSSKRYYLNGGTTIDLSSGKFKIMVLANWPAYPSSLTFGEAWRETFDWPGLMPSATDIIPLYGVKTINLPKIDPDVATNLGTIHLLRAVAKIEVILDNSDVTTPWTISKLQLTNYNTRGLCAPQVTDEDDYRHNNWADDYTKWLYIPGDDLGGAARRQDLDFTQVDDNRYVAYVTEYANTTRVLDSDKALIRVNFTGSFLGDRYIELRDPVSDTPLDIFRNIWYKVTIRKQPEQTDINITVDVIPYLVKELDPIFGLDPQEE